MSKLTVNYANRPVKSYTLELTPAQLAALVLVAVRIAGLGQVRREWDSIRELFRDLPSPLRDIDLMPVQTTLASQWIEFPPSSDAAFDKIVEAYRGKTD